MYKVILLALSLVGLSACKSDLALDATPQRSPVSLVAAAAPSVRCARFKPESSTAFDPIAKAILLPWRGDLPTALNPAPHAWETVELEDWRAYMAAVLSEVRAGQLALAGTRLTMAPTASWWISPWMDFTSNGREPVHGLTRERSPEPGDLAPGSPARLQVWAVGFYNAPGAYGLQQVFADPCDPKVPAPGWTFPEGSASFKLLFTNATSAAVPYLEGSPEIEAYIDTPGGGRSLQTVRLLQMDIAVKDRDSPTGWVFGTYVWKGPKTGDGLLDNLVPVGLMWGNDPKVDADPLDGFAALKETKLNMSLAGSVWRGPGQAWPQRPWPGFQGRLNGPADNLRSSCLSCHALAQWPRSSLGIVPSKDNYDLPALASPAVRAALRKDYFQNVTSGTLTRPADAQGDAERGPAVSLDYSLQLEAGFSRICAACVEGVLSGKTPTMCKVRRPSPAIVINTPNCPPPKLKTFYNLAPESLGDEPPPRQ